jgi:hypothetical protein
VPWLRSTSFHRSPSISALLVPVCIYARKRGYGYGSSDACLNQEKEDEKKKNEPPQTAAPTPNKKKAEKQIDDINFE